MVFNNFFWSVNLNSILICVAVCLILPILLVIINIFLQRDYISDREKSSPYECGFDPIRNARIPFSLRFFILAVLFLVFDIEIVILLPLPLIRKIYRIFFFFLPCFILIFILMLGLIHEWNEGSLSWSK